LQVNVKLRRYLKILKTFCKTFFALIFNFA
jgi:hypothetical protein